MDKLNKGFIEIVVLFLLIINKLRKGFTEFEV